MKNQGSKVIPQPIHFADEIPTRHEDESRRIVAATVWQFRGLLLIIIDAIAVIASFMLAYYLRFYTDVLITLTPGIGDIVTYLKGAILLTVVWIFLNWREGAYEFGLNSFNAAIQRIRSLFITCVYSLSVLMIISYLYRELLLSRQVYIVTGVFSVIIMYIARLLVRAMDEDLAAKGFYSQRLAFVGTDSQVDSFLSNFSQVESRTRIIGYISWDSQSEHKKTGAKLKRLGSLSQLSSIYTQNPFEVLVLSNSAWSDLQAGEKNESVISIVNFCESENIILYTAPSTFDVAVSKKQFGSYLVYR